MRSLLVIFNQSTTLRPIAAVSPTTNSLPETVLEANGYHIMQAQREERAQLQITQADAVILHLPLDDVKVWCTKISKWKSLPILWWCSDTTASLSAAYCEDDVPIDGILTPSMSSQEMHWALHFGSKQFFERQQWFHERKQLEARLEERKWIDMAKGILCKMKNVTEAEAYDLLRKQAMNDRKRMVDVATSIIQVYQLLQEQK